MNPQQMNLRQINRQQGFSLIELLLSIALGSILMFGVIEIYANSKQTYRHQDALSRLQENARYALDILVKDIRRSGYIGCANLSNVTPNIVASSPTITAYIPTSAFTGNQSTAAQAWTPSLPTNVTSVADNTDAITVMNAGSCSASLLADMASTTADVAIATANSCGFDQNDVVIVSDCTKADVFRISNTPGATGLLSHSALSSSYAIADAAEVLSFSSKSYFIRNDGSSGIPSLFVLDNTQATSGNNPVALIEGVENMQLLYGIDSDNDGTPEVYNNANSVADWSQVVTARLTLLMRTIDNVDAGAFTFNVGGTNVTYNDGALRKTFIATVQLRNRGL